MKIQIITPDSRTVPKYTRASFLSLYIPCLQGKVLISNSTMDAGVTNATRRVPIAVGSSTNVNIEITDLHTPRTNVTTGNLLSLVPRLDYCRCTLGVMVMKRKKSLSVI